MLYRVSRPFRQGPHRRMPGQIIELEFAQAARFRAMGLVGNVPREKAVAQPAERAVAPGSEHAEDRPPRKKMAPRKKKAPEPMMDPEEGGDGSG